MGVHGPCISKCIRLFAHTLSFPQKRRILSSKNRPETFRSVRTEFCSDTQIFKEEQEEEEARTTRRYKKLTKKSHNREILIVRPAKKSCSRTYTHTYTQLPLLSGTQVVTVDL